MTVFRVALRLGRVGAVAAAAIGVAAALGQTLAFAQLVGNTPLERAVFAQQMTILGRQLTYILPVPQDLGTMGGWVEWRAIGPMPLLLGVWALLASTGAARGDEDRGLVEHFLAAGVSRGGYLAARVGAFGLLSTFAIAAMVIALAVGSAIGNEPLPLSSLAIQSVPLLGAVLCCYAIGLVVSQLTTTRRGAMGIAAGAVIVLYAIDVSTRTGGDLAVRVLSPFWLYDETHALLVGGSMDGPATAALYLAAGLLLGLAALTFARRDVGDSLLRRAAGAAKGSVSPSGDPLLGAPVLALMDQQRGAIVVWTAGVAGIAVFLLSFTRTAVDTLLATPTFRLYLDRAGLGSYTAFVGVVWLSTAVLLVAIYAIVQASGWAADDAEGRLEVVLTQPVSRGRVVLERLAALLLSASIVTLGAAIATLAAAAAAGIDIDAPRFWLASALLLTVVFAFGGLGAAGVAWRPRLAVGALTAVALWSYFVEQFAPLFGWPRWMADLSLFALYGQPLSDTIDWARIGALGALGALGSAAALVAMRRRDVGA